MSWQASKYAREQLEAGIELTTAARLVLLLLAERAGTRNQTGYGGGWLCQASGLNERTVRRAMWQLHELGLVRVVNPQETHYSHRALRAVFPTGAYLSPTRSPVTGVDAGIPVTSDRDTGHQRPGYRSPATVKPYVTSNNHTPHATTCQCDGTGYIDAPERTVNGRTSTAVQPCAG